jgi:serine/threonine-protein kinase HipA
MTMLDRRDGDAPASYLEIANLLVQHGARAPHDLEQLWRRIVFFVCVSNIDDHLRNHGLLLGPKGWALAPAFDVNPSTQGEGLILNISEDDNSQSLELVRDVAKHFRIKTAKRADAIIAEVRKAVSTWRAVATATKIRRSEHDRMAPAFRLASP